jgi:hypothetical protein
VSSARAPAFGASFLIFGALLWVAWKVDPDKRAKNLVVKEALRG